MNEPILVAFIAKIEFTSTQHIAKANKPKIRFTTFSFGVNEIIKCCRPIKKNIPTKAAKTAV